MRGKAPLLQRGEVGRRITPAYAGKRKQQREITRNKRDHPRLCGEKRLKVAHCFNGCGITPAYAGKRPCTADVTALVKDHPRLCGEKNVILQLSITVVGSPPPMRGKGFIFAVRVKRQRITPAYAGKRNKR